MSAFDLLLRELVRNGGAVTYAQLVARHGKRYSKNTFANAVHIARQKGLVTRDRRQGTPIKVALGAECPCCGRKL